MVPFWLSAIGNTTNVIAPIIANVTPVATRRFTFSPKNLDDSTINIIGDVSEIIVT
jgi:hypothetical protein